MTYTKLFCRYSEAIQRGAQSGFYGTPLPVDLLMGEESGVSTYYAPFDHVNVEAKLVIVGITPGLTQAKAALCFAAKEIACGLSVEQILEDAKSYASFSGPMRSNLVAMMDCIGLDKYLGVGTTASLFSNRTDLVHFTSVLRYPVFVNSKNYNGQPALHKVELLQKSLRYFAEEAGQLRSALFLPLGKLPNEFLKRSAEQGLLSEEKVLFGLPHPSNANSERISYFLGSKPAKELSRLTKPEPINAARLLMVRKLANS